MRYWPLIFKNAMRNPRRSMLTLLSVAVSLMLLTLLLTVEDVMSMIMDRAGRSLRLSVRHKTSFAIAVPISYRARIAAVPGVVAVCPFAWYGGNYRDTRELLPSVACDPATLLDVWGDRLQADDAAWKRFKSDRMGAMVAQLQAARQGWKVGDTITLKGRAIPVDLTFHISGILTDTFDPLIFLFHYDYLDASNGLRGEVANFWLRVDSMESVPRVMRAIDSMFENAPQPTVTETEKSLFELVLGLMRMIRLVLLAIGSAVVVSIMLVTANTIAMSVRERTTELAVMRALGYRRRVILALVLCESCLLALAGGAAGSLAGWAICRWSGTIAPAGPVAALLATARPTLVVAGTLISLLVGIAGGIVPAVGAIRITVSQALRQVV